ncbi:MAG: hypothetical protein HKN85_04050 [Gammaproteobacteria bacterium]|nr:hypothetical protein [Gammaproteobacteria bacterium]
MALPRFTFVSFLLRLLFAVLLVFLTYNPLESWSYYQWALRPLLENLGDFSIPKALVGVALTIGWGIFLGATYASIGAIGALMLSLLFGLSFWWIIDAGWLSLDNPNTLTWLVLIALSALLAVGISWSHLRRRLTGQVDVDETEL